jgi:Z1 domain-containing protein
MSAGSANIVGETAVELLTDGPCLAGTLHQLEVGVGAKPMSRVALEKIRKDSLDLLEKVLVAYEKDVAIGEVGAKGSNSAGTTVPLSGNPTGLLYGRIQSGKTVAMITFCAAAIDNGFRVIVVLTSDFVKLVEQTADRFAALDGPLIKSALQSETWDSDQEHVRKHIADHGVVLICSKNQSRLAALVDFLQNIGAADFPAIVLDDEADQATLDTTVQARATGRANAPTQASVIHRRTVQDEEGQSVRQTLRHHIFLQVTATPYALLLQNINNELRPKFTHLLEPGGGYTGGEAFFDVQHVEDERPPVVFVDEEESDRIAEADSANPPLGLQQALAFFLIAAAAQNALDASSRFVGQNFLCHTSQKTADHTHVSGLIRVFLNRLGDDVRSGITQSESTMRLLWGYEELKKTLPDAPAFEQLMQFIAKRLPKREIALVNSANSPVEFSRQLNFIVGGNILGRGLTIDNLLVTYYLRRARVSQMDTVLQHARMFGYRQSIMPFTRVFLPEALGARFHFIHTAEKNLRDHLAATGGAGRVPVETMSALRATRLNVLDTSNLATYEAGAQIYPGAPSMEKKDLDRFGIIEDAVKQAAGGTLQDGKFVPVKIDALVSLLSVLPYNEDMANTWDPALLTEVLKRVKTKQGDTGAIYFRQMSRKKGVLPTGALSGKELEDARALGFPVLCAFRDDGKALTTKFKGSRYWYPTLVLPSEMATQLFNTSK